jgi:putative membrane protein insertion efficiency factor
MVRLLIFFMHIYQATLSPILGHQCRYVPSCSNYFIEALEKKGLVKGTLLGLWRILRCHPFSKGGYDPVR